MASRWVTLTYVWVAWGVALLSADGRGKYGVVVSLALGAMLCRGLTFPYETNFLPITLAICLARPGISCSIYFLSGIPPEEHQEACLSIKEYIKLLFSYHGLFNLTSIWCAVRVNVVGSERGGPEFKSRLRNETECG